jgi:hypothetical protein
LFNTVDALQAARRAKPVVLAIDMEASSLALPVPKHLCDAESSLSCIFNNMARFVFRFVLGSFFHRDVFSTTSPLRVPVRSGSFFSSDSLFSMTSPVRFSKKVFFFVFDAAEKPET